MTEQDIEQKLKDLGSATAPRHSLVTPVMERVGRAQQPKRRRFLGFVMSSSGLRAAAAVLVIAGVVAMIAVGLRVSRTPHHPAPVVNVQKPLPGALAVRVLDIRRIDLKSADALDELLREGSPFASQDSVIRVADVSRSDLNLY